MIESVGKPPEPSRPSTAPEHRQRRVMAQPAKLCCPQAPPFQIFRSALTEQLTRSNGFDKSARVSLIRAPAGFGKSTLMRQLFEQLSAQGVATAWMRLDLADNDSARLLHFLARALDSLSADTVEHGDDAPGAAAMDLLDRVELLPVPFALFLDDLEVLQNSVALAFVRQLAERLPEGGRLIIGSRTQPDIGLARLRARGQLQEVDANSLRFSTEETAQFLLRECGLEIAPEDIATLHQTTEGWAAALWLAYLALEQSRDPAGLVAGFSGSSALVADYLGEEVLANQPQELRDFMLSTSVLPQLSAELCDAVCEAVGVRGSSQERLLALSRNRFLLEPMDEEGRWFRYHSMFAGFLQGQLQQRYPQKVTALHRAAAQAYLAQGRVVPAIEQALKSGDMDYALPLFAGHAERLLGDGRGLLLIRLMTLVPAGKLQQWPGLQVVHVWAIAFTRGAAEAMAQLSEYEQEAPALSLVHRHGMALRPMLLSMLDRHDEAYRIASDNLSRLPVTETFPHAILRTSLAYVALVVGNYREAQDLLDEGRRLQVIDCTPFTHIYAQCVEGAIELLQGRLRQGTARFRLAAGVSERNGRPVTNGNAMAAVLLSEVWYESGQFADAERLLQVYVPLVQEQGVPDHLICGHRNLARILYARGDHDGAFQTITELEYFGYRNELPRLVASARLERSRIFLLEGDKQSARDELKRAQSAGDWDKFAHWSLFGSDLDTPADAELRWKIHFADSDAAARSLKPQISLAEAAGRGRRALKLRLLYALALYRAGNEKAALRQLRDVLRIAASEHYVRLILDEGELAVQLLQRLASQQGVPFDQAQLARDPQTIFRQLVRELAVAAGSGISGDTAGGGPTAAAPTAQPVQTPDGKPVEKLTRKEFQVLCLLGEGLSNGAIGERMFVSENTVRTHLRNINAKLHTQSRTEAVAVARKLNLIG
ncbi:LuxR C-terminal-related transcriptional regulator [Microbulbifer sp. CAU 1566]|uniref:LuxR C-terminal-related transcriptional regulator n=1 Tax=Microbulbifer sp. CAU 1566 TaxID=2933269 RepID=UPI0020037EE1|nr:LuxR C-terminal-related transcriptional regulator [Microbulbifer sp. CAU 1566]MCK7597531.1 LuxR C-terminal-related transcriptional regulator [Microbulbifer sp. CAU 1566]